MPATKDLTVTTGWGQGRKARFLGFADGEGGLLAQHVSPSTTVITRLASQGRCHRRDGRRAVRLLVPQSRPVPGSDHRRR